MSREYTLRTRQDIPYRHRGKYRRRRAKQWEAAGIIAAILLFCVFTAVFLWVSVLTEEPIPESSGTGSTHILDAETSDADEDPYLILVNKQNPIPEDHEPDLVKVAGGESVDRRIYDPLMQMLEDARSGNLGQMPLVVSGYRTAKVQQKLYDDKVTEYKREGYSQSEAESLAGQWVSVPGHSEHQLGLAVDINGSTYDLYLWLQENSYKYGFIFRYPGDKTEITGVAEEVWHYRYVGVKAAAEIYEQGLCLEEYLESL